MTPKTKAEAIEQAGDNAFDNMTTYGSCSQSTVLALQDVFDMSDDDMLKAASAMSGGIGGMQDACGSLLGGSMMLGVVCGRSRDELKDRDKLAEVEMQVGKLYMWYEKEFGSPTCYKIREAFGDGMHYDLRIPWQRQLASEAGVLMKCAELVEKTAGYVAGVMWDILEAKKK